MRKTALRKKSKQKISVIQRKLWEECKRIIRTRYGNSCYTCPRTGLVGSDWHTGHMWAKASVGASLKYDLRLLRPQCYNCNINLGGQGAVFYARMLRENGSELMAQLEQDKIEDKRGLLKAIDHYLMLLEQYKQL